MSARSTRRAAEMAVIDAACEYLRATQGLSQHTTGQYQALSRAVRAFEALGLERAGTAITTNAPNDTSNAAAASLDPDHLGRLARRVYDEISYAAAEGSAGLTCDQVEQLLSGSHQTISARVNELRDKGYIVDSGVRRPTRSGRKAAVWRPSAMGPR